MGGLADTSDPRTAPIPTTNLDARFVGPASSPPSATSSAPGPTSASIFDRRLLFGSVGKDQSNDPLDVAGVQTMLKDFGLDPGPVDGKFGASTEAALKRGQGWLGVPADGLLKPGGVTERTFRESGRALATANGNTSKSRPKPVALPAWRLPARGALGLIASTEQPGRPERPKPAALAPGVKSKPLPPPREARTRAALGPKLARNLLDRTALTARLPAVSDESRASSSRLVDALLRTSDDGDLPRLAAHAIGRDGRQALAELRNLIGQLQARNPARANRLKESIRAELGPENAASASRLDGPDVPTGIQQLMARSRARARGVPLPRGFTHTAGTDQSREARGTLIGPGGEGQSSEAPAARKPPAATKPLPVIKGTTFFGGAGLDGAYVQDMVKAFEDAGMRNVRAADPEKWSRGMFPDAASVLSERHRDDDVSDFSAFGSEGDQFNLVGYSYGGLQAAQGAADYADLGGKVDNLVLIGTPISAEFLKELENHPNIGSVKIIELTEHGYPLRAGMDTLKLIGSVPELGLEFLDKRRQIASGHFYYAEESPRGELRRRELARRLFEEGLR